MRNIFVFIVTVFFLGFVSWKVGSSLGKPQGVVRSIQDVNVLQPAPTIHTNIVISSPKTIAISSLNLTAPLEHVGLDERKHMGVPKEDMNAAWYMLGAKVGEKGSAVIAGHYDTKAGDPAVFYEINKLKIGDEITITGENGKTLIFVVQETKTVKDASFPIEEVFVRNDAIRLNLITCAGVFDRAAKNYEDRFIVYSVLKEA